VTWESQYVLGAAEAKRVVEENKAVFCNRVALFKWDADVASELGQTVEWFGAQESKQGADVLKSVLNRRASQAPTRPSLDVGAVPVYGSRLPADNVR